MLFVKNLCFVFARIGNHDLLSLKLHTEYKTPNTGNDITSLCES